jgi:hypothetical protein
MLVGIQTGGFELPNYHVMTDHVRQIAVYIRDDLKLSNCQIIKFEGCLPAQWAVIFTDKVTKIT